MYIYMYIYNLYGEEEEHILGTDEVKKLTPWPWICAQTH